MSPFKDVKLEYVINHWTNESMIFNGIYFVNSIASGSGFVQSMDNLEIETKSLKYYFLLIFDPYLGHSNGRLRWFYSLSIG